MRKIVLFLLILALGLSGCGGDAQAGKAGVLEAAGTWADGAYENGLLGIHACFDGGWYIEADGENAAQSLRDSGSALDLYAIRPNGSSVNLVLQRMGLLQRLLISETRYVRSALERLPEVLADQQVEDVRMEAVTVTFGGSPHAGLRLTGVQGDVNFYEQLVVVKAGSYFGVVTASSYLEDTTDSILNGFTGI